MSDELLTLKADPLRTLSLMEVVRRTGYSRRTIYAYLAKDTTEKTPGRRFPRPFKKPGTDKMIWRETTLMQWFDEHERNDAA